MINAIVEARRIREATGFVTNGSGERFGKATQVAVAKGSLKITLDTGDTVTWRCAKDVATAIAAEFWLPELVKTFG